MFCQFLSSNLDRDVIDKTGIGGRFDQDRCRARVSAGRRFPTQRRRDAGPARGRFRGDFQGISTRAAEDRFEAGARQGSGDVPVYRTGGEALGELMRSGLFGAPGETRTPDLLVRSSSVGLPPITAVSCFV